MNPLRGLAPACLFAAAAALPGTAGAGAAAHTRPIPTAVGVGEREFRISVYRPSVAPGRLRLNVTNHGEDVHDIAVLDAHGHELAASGDIDAGARATVAVTLRRPGSYRLVCTKADHAGRGMRARLRVRPARRRGR